MKKILKPLSGMLLAMGLVSCASISVRDGSERAAPRMPDKIMVAPFDTERGIFRVDREGAELAGFKQNLRILAQTALVADLNRRLVSAVPTHKTRGFPRENTWLVRGEFTRVNQGSRFLRAAIGLGAGGTKMETRVRVYDLGRDSKTPFLTFSTTGGSGAEPGAILTVSTNPLEFAIQAALSSLGGIAHGITEDTRRTDRMITAVLSDYMYRKGWIPEEKWIKPKKLGGQKWPPVKSSMMPPERTTSKTDRAHRPKTGG